MVTELVVRMRMRMPTVSSSSLAEHLVPWLMDLEQGTQIVEVCGSTSLHTDPIMGFPISESVLGRQMGVDHSVADIWAGHDRRSARTFNLPGMCRAQSTIWLA